MEKAIRHRFDVITRARRRACVLGALLLGAASSSAQVYVDDDAPSDPYPNDPTKSGFEDGSEAFPFDTIAEALAAPGGLVILRPGTYAGPGNVDLTLKGAIVGERGADEVIVDLGKAATFGNVPYYCELSGLTIKNGLGEGAGAVEVLSAAELVVRHCVFRGNLAAGTGDQGGAITACGSLKLWNSAFVHNGTAGNGGAIAVACDSTELTVHQFEHNTFRGNYALGTGGALHYAGHDKGVGSSRIVYASIFAENAAGAGVPDVSEEHPGEVGLYDSIVQVPWTGSGVGSFVAALAFAETGDWHLVAASPAIGGAVGSSICLVDPQDADDQTRDCLVSDVGADEYALVTYAAGEPHPGSVLKVRLSGAAAGAPALMTVSAKLLDAPVLLGFPYYRPYYLKNPLLLPPATTGAKGTAVWQIPLPAIAGLELFFQGMTAAELEASYTQVQILP